MARLLWMVCLVWAEFAAANIPAHRPVSGALPAPASSVTVNGQSAERYGDFSFARTNLSLTGNDTFTIIAQNQFGSATNSATYNLPASISLTHDANGNLTSDGTRSFFYNAENRLTNITVTAKWKAEFVYDGLSRRRIMREYGWQGGQWVKTNEVRFVWDGFLPIQERDGNNLVKLSYTRGPDLSGSLQGAGGIGGLLARTDSAGNSLFYHADGAGNVTALMDMAGNVAGRYQYGPFGRLSGMWGSMAPANVMRFSSMPYHDKGGMVGYYSRFYDPNLQRWTTQDPIGELGGINLYPFVRNDPLSYVDPYGQDFHVVHASGIQAPGPFGYLSGDTDIENLLAGGYNVVPQVGNVVASAMQGLGLLMQGAVDLAKTGARALGADPGTEDLIGRGVEAAMVVFPLGRAGKCERLLAAEEAAGVQANKLAGDAIRDAIAAREAPALTEHVFNTVGGVRRTDVLRLGNELVGIESKVGRTALDSRVRQELARDWWLQRQGQLDRIMWEFSPSEVTGQVGPTRQLAEKLGRLGFDMRINQ